MSQVFTDEDNLFPIYCVSCKAHTPRLFSDQNQGRCEACVFNDAAKVAQAHKDATAAQAKAAYERYHTDTRMGECSNCRSRNIRQFDVLDARQSNATTAAVAGTAVAGASAGDFGLGLLGASAPIIFFGCLFAVIFLPCLVLLAIFAFPFFLLGAALVLVLVIGIAFFVIPNMSKKKVGTSRECLNCGHRWPV
jgi:hypothetical protein